MNGTQWKSGERRACVGGAVHSSGEEASMRVARRIEDRRQAGADAGTMERTRRLS